VSNALPGFSCSVRSALGASALLLLVACSGPQSALDTASHEAARIARLCSGMVIGGSLIWLLVVGFALYAAYAVPEPDSGSPRWLIAVGLIVPTGVLAGLLGYGLWMLPDYLAPAPPGSLRIAVSGEQWWWRVRYLPAQGKAVDLANELRLPLGEPVELELESPDVIHSLWIPALGGKMDMIPGRKTRLRLHPTRAGTFRGVCAEYCGTSHALMALPVVVEERRQFDSWLSAQGEDARPADSSRAQHGQRVLLSSGCGACHTIRGTAADGVIGPDLTHVGGRLSLGAGTLKSGGEQFYEFIARTDAVKPAVHMPAFGMLPHADLQALALYLKGLE
jgi:cytochrome c oxidase subunit 2